MRGLFGQVPVWSAVYEREHFTQYLLWTMTDILKTQKQDFCRRAIYGMIDSSRNTIFSWWKIPNGHVKLKTVVNLKIKPGSHLWNKNKHKNKDKRRKSPVWTYIFFRLCLCLSSVSCLVLQCEHPWNKHKQLCCRYRSTLRVHSSFFLCLFHKWLQVWTFFLYTCSCACAYLTSVNQA